MSEWDEFDPEQQRREMLKDPVKADRLIAADKRLIAAMNKMPVDLEALKESLTAEACPDRIIINGMPALHVAIHKHDIKALDLLLRHAARTDDWDIEGATALDEAYRKRFHDGIKMLKLFSAEPRLVRRPDDEEPEAVYAPSYEMRMNTLLVNMIRRGTALQVKQAIELGANVNMSPPGNQNFWPPLHIAIAQCEPDKVKVLVEAGADIFARSSLGQEVVDELWHAPVAKLLGPEWSEIFDYLHEKGYSNFFVKHPSQFTLNDLRQQLPTGDKKAPTLLHHLIHAGQAEFVFNVLQKNPDDRLTAADFLKKSEQHRQTLLETCAGQGLLPKIFTADIWQGRLEEMLSLRNHVDNSFSLRGKVDFNKASSDVRACRLRELKVKAPKLQLKRL
jgi:ankyrin repeat protein